MPDEDMWIFDEFPVPLGAVAELPRSGYSPIKLGAGPAAYLMLALGLIAMPAAATLHFGYKNKRYKRIKPVYHGRYRRIG
jgi:hypothetical protein